MEDQDGERPEKYQSPKSANYETYWSRDERYLLNLAYFKRLEKMQAEWNEKNEKVTTNT